MIKTVRDGRKVWPYCNECGCRLDIAALDTDGMAQRFIGHFYHDGKRDARGCRCRNLRLYAIMAVDDLIHLFGV